jgi:hypothetical protein
MVGHRVRRRDDDDQRAEWHDDGRAADHDQ